MVGRSSTPRAGHLPVDVAPIPGPGDPALRVVLALTAVLQGLSWWLHEGYPLADSVEYMERAQAVVRGVEVVDSRSIRAVGFIALLAPFFAVADLVGAEDLRPLVALVRLLQIGLGLALVLVCARVGARLAGRRAGIAAAFLVGANPVFLEVSVTPLADVAAALCVALGVEALLAPPVTRAARRAALRAGSWLGLALLMAYKTAPIAGVLAGLVLLRGRRRAVRPLLHFGAAYAAWILVGMGLDRVIYGDFGASLLVYVADNVAGILVGIFVRLGLRAPAKWIFAQGWGAERAEQAANNPMVNLTRHPEDWYWTHLDEMFVWPVVLVGILALVRLVRRPTWPASLLAVTAAANIALLCLKSAKEFRLWIPLLPLLAPLLGAGWSWALEGRGGRLNGARGGLPWRAAATAALALLTVALGVRTLLGRNLGKFAGFWRAMEHVSRDAAESGADGLRVASAFHWAVFLRAGPGVHLTKLAHQPDGWRFLDEEARARVLDELRGQDRFITHLPLLADRAHADLTRAVNDAFEVEAMFWERERYEELGPILVLRRRPAANPDGAPDVRSRAPRRSLFDVIEDEDPDAYRRRMGFAAPVRLIRPELGEELWFLGATCETVPGDEIGWITYHYACRAACRADYKIFDRITTNVGGRAWRNDHAPAWGTLPTSAWRPGWIVRESWPLALAAEPYRWDAPYRPLGGPYRRGDLIPAALWLDFATDYLRCTHCAQPLEWKLFEPHTCGGVERTPEDGEMVVSGRLEPARGPTEGGVPRSADGFSRVQRLFVPVHPDARVPDDGRPLPEEP